MGDHELPYWLLEKIMYTCQSEDFARAYRAFVAKETPVFEGD